MSAPVLPPGFTLEALPVYDKVAVVLMRGTEVFAREVACSPRAIRRAARKLAAVAHACHALDRREQT